MKILIVSPQYYPIVGGYERAAERLSRSLVERGHAVTVVTERRDRSWDKREAKDGVEIRRLWCIYVRKLHLLTGLSSLALFLLSEGKRYDIWHIYQYGIQAALGAVLARFLGKPLVLRSTSTGDSGIERVISQLPFPTIAKRVLCNVNAIVVVSTETRAEALAFGIPANRVHLVSSGIDQESFKPSSAEERRLARTRLGINASGLVLFVGRLSAEKNPDGLIQAWAKAVPHLPDHWKLAVVGDGSMRVQLESLIDALRCSETVILAGLRSDIQVWMAAADIFVMPSNFEGLSNSILEAMASGLPIISTKTSGSRELLIDSGAGVVVEIGNEMQLSNAIIRLVSDVEGRTRMGKTGRKVIEEGYSLSSVVAAHEHIYRTVLDSIAGASE